MKNNKSMARRVSLSGILLSINTLVFLSINYIPTNTIILMAIASLFSSIVIIEIDFKTGCIYTIASIIMAFFIITNKIHFLTYSISFGIYGVSKAIIEKKVNKNFQIMVKLVYANTIFITLYAVTTLFVKVELTYSNIILTFMLMLAFVVYDYFYSQFINFYINKISIKINNIK